MLDLSARFSPFADAVRLQKYSHILGDGTKENWRQTANRVSSCVLGSVNASKDLIDECSNLIYQRKLVPGGRYLYAAGRPLHQTQNCVLNRADDSREGWSEHLYKATMSLTTGAGLGVVYSDIREEGAVIRGSGGVATGPCPLICATNEVGRGIKQGGSRRSALWAGLHWWHPDVFKYISLKDWPEYIRKSKENDYDAYAPCDGTNISIILDTNFFKAYGDPNFSATYINPKNGRSYFISHELAKSVYWKVVSRSLRTGEPGFSIDAFENEGENNRNACTEICSYDDSDICNLGSINLAKINSLEEMEHVVEISTAFLLAGTVYSDVPYEKIRETRTKNRRLGLGLMGIHEWLLRHGKRYGQDSDLEKYLVEYQCSDEAASCYSDLWNLSMPVKTRAIAPTGSISILAETTSGCEPIFASAYKRRYLDGKQWRFQYVVDPITKSLVDSGIRPENIEDCYSISPDRRIGFQSWLQNYVDHCISSTINLPSWGSEKNNPDRVEAFGNTLMGYLPSLRGITMFPDGSRGSGQPLTSVSYKTAIKHVGEVFFEQGDVCDIRGGGSCGS
jgi:ribonucleoside-diphosphate reductase alpha chain